MIHRLSPARPRHAPDGKPEAHGSVKPEGGLRALPKTGP
ncbi:Hypothetical protein BSSP2_I0158 [Brucella suis bv. 2]|nr:Hypothetical protein BSSP3_I0158 [Brucella suis bv. 2]AIB20270.1 Hypothetical protein BSPT1_I0160 [Brucella suis bv. 2]AIB23640.1 Hypothetical protein BSPT2_I0160 [Brucella suis bv. 2]AIB27031.1 Hypothetical protein BSSP1_I0158 [Brucella suis bv. 2]AIB30394.1 Hypothetical protein BSSP2_I0158 [Brucella suis bv. 2]